MKTYIIDKGFLNNKKSILTVDEKTLTLNGVVLRKEEIIGIRYGIHFIRGYMATIGREYQIFIKTVSGKEMKISFRLFYGRKLNEKHKLYCEIIDTLWENFYNDILKNYINKFLNKEDLIISGIKISNDKITFGKEVIPWENLMIKKYYHYFIIFSETDQYHNKMLYYLNDQDAVILSELLNYIIKNELYRTEKVSHRQV
ncbi:hypothetical protein [Chryseobacterium sp. POE27]|uniref:hypothetical protein n=1 Tax=Chryseobacterium sp. POE27 TaxID=3138177 RepID=UPI003219B9DA